MPKHHIGCLATNYLKSQVFIRTLAFLGVTGRDKERYKRSEKRNGKEDRHGEKNRSNDVQYKQTKMLVTKEMRIQKLCNTTMGKDGNYPLVLLHGIEKQT